MARRFTVKVEGLRETDAALSAIGKRATAKNVAKRALTNAAKPLDDGWRGRVRVDSGDLKQSGGISTKLSRRQRAQHKKQAPVEVFVGPGPNPQAITEEFGTPNQAPNGALRGAWDQHKAAIPAAVGSELWSEISKVAARQARKAARLAAKG